jgi:hypothetical protein
LEQFYASRRSFLKFIIRHPTRNFHINFSHPATATTSTATASLIAIHILKVYSTGRTCKNPTLSVMQKANKTRENKNLYRSSRANKKSSPLGDRHEQREREEARREICSLHKNYLSDFTSSSEGKKYISQLFLLIM